MRVVHLVCSDGFAGVERYIVNTAAGLARKGVDVAVVGGARERMTAALDGTDVAWAPGDSMRQAGASLRSLAVPDLVNTHMSQADLVGALYRSAPGRRRVAHVSTRHFMGARGTGPFARAGLLLADRSIDREIAISAAVAEFAGESVDVVHTGVPTSSAVRSRERFVLVAQRLEPEKDTATAIDGWALSKGPAKGWMLRIAGDGSQRAVLVDRARERGVAASVEFLGHRDDVPELLRAASVVVAPTPREGLGILVLEAMAEATPVVAAAGGGHLETVGAIAPECLFAPGDAVGMAGIVDALIDDSGRCDRLGRAMQALQRSRFTLEGQVATTLAVYRKVLAR